MAYKCKDCIWLDLNYKSSVGYRCVNPNIKHEKLGYIKQKCNPACVKGFEGFNGETNERRKNMGLRDEFKAFCDGTSVAGCKRCKFSTTTEECLDAFCYEKGFYAGYLKGGEEIGNACAYQSMASRTINHDLSISEQEMHALHGMVGEIGELHSLYQKKYQGHEFDSYHAKKELGDLLWFIAEYCTANNWSLQDVMNLNIAKLRSRYPEGFEADKSLNRKQGDI